MSDTVLDDLIPGLSIVQLIMLPRPAFCWLKAAHAARDMRRCVGTLYLPQDVACSTMHLPGSG